MGNCLLNRKIKLGTLVKKSLDWTNQTIPNTGILQINAVMMWIQINGVTVYSNSSWSWSNTEVNVNKGDLLTQGKHSSDGGGYLTLVGIEY